MDPSIAPISTEPRLPTELECLIFGIAALSHPVGIPNLMLVAWRVRQWVEPLLYRIVFISSESDSSTPKQQLPPRIRQMPPHIRVFSADVLLRLIAAKPPGFIQNAVKHLFIEEATTSEAEAIFTACNHVTNLFDNGTYAHDVRALLTLQYIQRLALVISTFLERYTIDNTPSVFRNITHLELLGSCWDHTDLNDVCVRLGLIPSLTHVAFNFAPLHEIFYTTLRADMRLLCIVFLSLDTDEVNNTNPLAGDFRFVCIDQRTAYRVDWLRGADTNDDYWALADSFIAARRMAKVERTLYRIADTDQRWKN